MVMRGTRRKMVDQKPQLFFKVKELPQILFAVAYKLSLTKSHPRFQLLNDRSSMWITGSSSWVS